MDNPRNAFGLRPSGPGASLPNLLFVDDEPAILNALRIVFRRGYQVQSTTDGEEALQWLATREIDVIVCDQRMPRLTGVEVLSRARIISPPTARILLTGYADSDAVMGAINEGEAMRFLQKPWDNALLKLRIDEAVRSARQRRAAQSEIWGDPMSGRTAEPRTGARIVPFPPVQRVQGREVDVELDIPVAAAQTSAAPGALPALPAQQAPTAALQNVLAIDSAGLLSAPLAQAAQGEFAVRSIQDVAQAHLVLQREPVRLVVLTLGADSGTGFNFLKALKTERPDVVTIVICDAVDATQMIDLINHARVFRFFRHPVSMPLLVAHLRCAADAAAQAAQG
jgi:DNA-binding NtrC family response regulator